MGATKDLWIEQMEKVDYVECETCGKKNVNIDEMPWEGGSPVWVLCDVCAYPREELGVD